jgi:hypothetical protein
MKPSRIHTDTRIHAHRHTHIGTDITPTWRMSHRREDAEARRHEEGGEQGGVGQGGPLNGTTHTGHVWVQGCVWADGQHKERA